MSEDSKNTHLCNDCHNDFATCQPEQVVFGNGYGGDNVVSCTDRTPSIKSDTPQPEASDLVEKTMMLKEQIARIITPTSSVSPTFESEVKAEQIIALIEPEFLKRALRVLPERNIFNSDGENIGIGRCEEAMRAAFGE